MTAADMASISEQPDVYQELVEASFIFSTIMQVLVHNCTLIIVVVQKILRICQWEFCIQSFNLDLYNASFQLVEGYVHLWVCVCMHACDVCGFVCVCVCVFLRKQLTHQNGVDVYNFHFSFVH